MSRNPLENDVANQESEKDSPEKQQQKKLNDAFEKGAGNVLKGFSDMVENLFSGKQIDKGEQQKKTEEYKKQADAIMKDPDMNAEWRQNALKKLYGTVETDAAIIPNRTDEQNHAGNEKQKTGIDDFNTKLLKTISENRVSAEGNNQLLAKKINENTQPPAHGGKIEWEKDPLTEAIDNWP